jgi:hypothetical protein
MADRIRPELCAPRSSASTSSCHENCVEQLLHLRVPFLRILKDLADKVHLLLLDFCCGLWPFHNDDCANHGVGSCHIQ